MSERDGYEPGVPCWIAAVHPDPDGVDATAERAAALGGKVVIAPCDTPVSRSAALADPQGATFTATTITIGQ